MSFRRRLALTITALLGTGYLAFAMISLALLEGSIRSEFDSKLTTIARAASDLIDDVRGRPFIDGDDVTQFDALHAADEHLGIYAPGGKLIFGEPLPSGPSATRLTIVREEAVHQGHHLGHVVVWRDTSWITSVRRNAILTFALTGLVLGALAFIFSGIYARAILTPVERVANLAERLESSDLSQRLHAQGRDELARLCASFDRMLERLQASFDAERRFVSDASHELRAPLAVVRAETDLALRRERSRAEYRLALESIGRETKRLEELVNRLLQTMRKQAVTEREPVDALSIAASLVRRMRNAASNIGITSSASEVLVSGNAEALQRALSAVLHNAITHGRGNVAVELTLADSGVRITIRDRGPGFTAEALHHATERFWRGDSVRSREGTGLGLSIAHALIEAHGGSLSLANHERGGAIVTIELPRHVRAVVTV